MHHPRVAALLDDSGDDVAVTALEVTEHLLVLGVPQSSA